MRLLVGYIGGVVKCGCFLKLEKKTFLKSFSRTIRFYLFYSLVELYFFLNIILYAFVVLHLEIVTFSRQGILSSLGLNTRCNAVGHSSYDTRLLLLKYSNFSFDCSTTTWHVPIFQQYEKETWGSKDLILGLLQCDYYNRGHLDKLGQLDYRTITKHSEEFCCQS